MIVAPISPVGIPVQAPSAFPRLAEVCGSVYGPLVMLLVSPTDHRQHVRKMRVLSMPVLANSAEGLTNRAGAHGERVLSSVGIHDSHALNGGVQPHPGQLEEVHRPIAVEFDRQAWVCVQEDAHSLVIEHHPIRDLCHGAASM